MARVMLVDDDPGVLATVGAILQLQGHHVSRENTAGAGIRTAWRFLPQVALIDLRLPDKSGLDVVSALRNGGLSTRCVVVTGDGDLSSAVEAIRRGACDYLLKPVFEEDIAAAISRALDNAKSVDAIRDESTDDYDLRRWSEAIVRFMTSARDATTLKEFGRSIGVSSGAFRNWCRTAHVSSRRSLRFARALRAVRLVEIEGPNRPQTFLNIVDLRTLGKFLLASGGSRDCLPPTVEEFLCQQTHVRVEAAAAVRLRLSDLSDAAESLP